MISNIPTYVCVRLSKIYAAIRKNNTFYLQLLHPTGLWYLTIYYYRTHAKLNQFYFIIPRRLDTVTCKALSYAVNNGSVNHSSYGSSVDDFKARIVFIRLRSEGGIKFIRN